MGNFFQKPETTKEYQKITSIVSMAEDVKSQTWGYSTDDPSRLGNVS